MKKLILSVVICAAGVAATAQKVKVNFGVMAGVNLNTLKVEVPDARVYGAGVGFHGGVLARIQCSPGFAIQPQILYSQRKSTWGAGSEMIKSKMNGIDMPINFLYTEKNFFVGGGPSFRYGLSMEHKSSGMKIDPYNDEPATMFTTKRFEMGGSIVMGYKLKSGLFFAASYNPQFSDLGDGMDYKNHTAGISAGFIF